MVDEPAVDDRQSVPDPVLVQEVAAADVQSDADVRPGSPALRSCVVEDLTGGVENFDAEAQKLAQRRRDGVGVAVGLVESAQRHGPVAISPQCRAAPRRVEVGVAVVRDGRRVGQLMARTDRAGAIAVKSVHLEYFVERPAVFRNRDRSACELRGVEQTGQKEQVVARAMTVSKSVTAKRDVI